MDLKLKRVDRKTYRPKRACVYAISHPENLSGLETLMALRDSNPDIYFGVTAGKISQRWTDHKTLRKRDNQTTSRFIRDNHLAFEDCFRVIFEGTEDQCYRLEYHLRQNPDMGLNRRPGGKMKHRKLNKRYLDMIARAE